MDTQTSRFIAENLVYLLSAPCILTFLLFAWDKHLAIYKRQRVPEAVLLILSIFFGAFGGLCSMIFFNHKTHKPAFYITVPILAVIQIAAIVLFKLYLQK
ncbi:MAG: DUF1294 domain-containing protein [Prevotella sp.]|nr:DUF1294 domain-containing protein [Prevotella sp.]